MTTFTDTQGRTLENLGAGTRACPACDYQATTWPWRAACNGGEWRDGDPVLDFRLSKLLKARRVAA